MRVVLDNPAGGPSDLELQLGRDDATVGDLLDVLDSDVSAGGILVDGRFCHADLALSEIGLYEGARIALGSASTSRSGLPDTGLELCVIAGRDAGRRCALHPGQVTVGRDEDCDLRLEDEGISRHHLAVEPSAGGLRATVSDLGSANGTWIEGRKIERPTEIDPATVFEAGDVAFSLAARRPALPLDPVRQTTLAGTIPFNRPPRSRRTQRDEPLRSPEAPRETQRPRLSLVSAFAPLVLGAVMVIALHNILYAAFMLLSPVLVIGGWIEQRRQSTRSSRGDRRQHAEAMATFTREVERRRTDALAALRERLPDLAEIVRRATAPDPRLWERRPSDDDFLRLSAGLGEVPFRAELADRQPPPPDAELVLAHNGWLRLAPVEVDLSKGGVVGIVGPREPSLELARALLCQVAVAHGPADLMTAIFTEPPGREDWDWAKWLPHGKDTGGEGRLLAVGPEDGGALVSELTERGADDPRVVVTVLDSPALIEGRGAPGRALLRAGERVSGIVLSRSVERLPAACTTVIELEGDTGEARLTRPAAGEEVDPLLMAGLSAETARECAVALARFEDADLQLLGGSLPPSVGLFGLLGLGEPAAGGLQSLWESRERDPRLAAAFALSEDGPLEIDLVADGPHGLVAGTTGAGKSELLRSLVAALAARYAPTRVNFVLVDYKGGSAFAECAELPHTVGMVTDLDEQLGERALRSLEAELRYRERVLREHRASDLPEYDRQVQDGRADPLPRLLVIIDEFATLASELPDFVSSLVGIAQRGRSLGVHLVLATQRPSGAVNENIRANTNLRICLRVQTDQDSSDVIDSPAAAKIPRRQPGRAHVRLGPSELIPVQTALVTGVTPAERAAPVAVTPFTLNGGGDRLAALDTGGPSDLARLVAAARSAAADRPTPRRPWLEPLPDVVALDELAGAGTARPLAGERGLVVPMAMADDPEAQAQYPIGWNLSAGNLLLYGIGGSGTTTALATIALSLTELADPRHLHLYVLDFGAGELAPLAGLPHVGAVIGASEHERHRRLLEALRSELAARRGLDAAARAARPRIVLLLDGYGGFTSEHGDFAGDALRDALARLFADGPEVGIHTVLAADRFGAIPSALASLAQQRLAFQLADVADYAQFGLLRGAIPRFVPGRAVVGGSAQVIQFARPASALEVEVAERGGEPVTAAAGGPVPIGVLPETLPAAALVVAARPGREPLFLPLGIGDSALAPVGFELYEGDHALVAGPSRSGRTNVLLAAAELCAELHPDLRRVAIAGRRSALSGGAAVDRVVTDPSEIPELAVEIRAGETTTLLLIDDADGIETPGRALSDLFAGPLPNLHAIVAGRGDGLRTLGHWSVGVRRSRVGLLLQPDVQVDGALLGVTLPRRPAPPIRPGCGYRVDPGNLELMQVALASQ